MCRIAARHELVAFATRSTGLDGSRYLQNVFHNFGDKWFLALNGVTPKACMTSLNTEMTFPSKRAIFKAARSDAARRSVIWHAPHQLIETIIRH
jgi:hypothetical protein